MLPGTVTSDAQAFEQVLGRLESEAGIILGLIPAAKANGLWRDTVPLWSLVRMMFPVAESLADLIYRKDNDTAENLRKVLANEFEAVRPGGYRSKAATLTLLFRHSLTHTDELRMLVAGGRTVGWLLGYGKPTQHMNLVKANATSFGIHFDTTAFYEDLVKVCRNAKAGTWDGDVMRRYNGWLTLTLDAKPNPQGLKKEAIAEIAAF